MPWRHHTGLFPRKSFTRESGAFWIFSGVALGGANQPLGKILLKTVKDFGGKPQATVLGHGLKTSVMNAALVNGAMAHALDFDDTHTGSLGHPSAPVIPAVLAVAEWKGLSGKAALEAFIVGFEVETRIGKGMGMKHYDRGWHATSTFGRFGAAVAAGKLLGLSLEEMKHGHGPGRNPGRGLASGLRYHDQAFPSREIRF